ncbi:hypothetical protein SAMN05444398_1011056 [Roseovarius pacificus]|uniref:Uncharacterized protein n=1 Tax=Roseovarius pacificus TaxID=337701 RepID=A0A1M6YVK7_9RHOB|nr:hypothetical protein [Roseovarius pacificus]GGO50312.1 hypothetical protein GCM10011315_00780 [Roseovarius pacificus]SHL22306.1 hypothetical protein SAMN05444398_1011056 [Roseovarius pacificus]
MTPLDTTINDLAGALQKATAMPAGLNRDVIICKFAYVIGDLCRIKLIPQISEQDEYDLDLSAERIVNDILARDGMFEAA